MSHHGKRPLLTCRAIMISCPNHAVYIMGDFLPFQQIIQWDGYLENLQFHFRFIPEYKPRGILTPGFRQSRQGCQGLLNKWGPETRIFMDDESNKSANH